MPLASAERDQLLHSPRHPPTLPCVDLPSFSYSRPLARTSHPQNVINQFTATGKDPRVSFFGNVSLGKDVQLKDLRSLYHGVRALGGGLPGCMLGCQSEGGC